MVTSRRLIGVRIGDMRVDWRGLLERAESLSRRRDEPASPCAVHRPLLYDFAVYLARRYDCRQLVQFGPGRRLAGAAGQFPVAGLRLGREQRFVKRDPDAARHSLTVSADLDLSEPDAVPSLRAIRSLAEYAPLAVITTPLPVPEPSAEILQRVSAGFRSLLQTADFQILFLGSAFSRDLRKHSLVALATRPRPAPIVPASFRAVALVASFNEEDIVAPFLDYTIRQGIEVHLLDNWSTDRTVERASQFLGRGLRTIESFPPDGPGGSLDLYQILRRKEELALETPGDWFIHLDVDELRESPWPGLTLREALYRVDSEGFNAVDHSSIVFHPTGAAEYDESLPLDRQFLRFEFGEHSTYALQIKAWKRQAERVECALRGGHDVRFPGRRIYPYKFLLRHYPVRSQAHGERKVFRERLPRYSADGRSRGWHIQYDSLPPNHSFVRDPATLSLFDPHTFYEDYLMERLSSVGVDLEDPALVRAPAVAESRP